MTMVKYIEVCARYRFRPSSLFSHASRCDVNSP